MLPIFYHDIFILATFVTVSNSGNLPNVEWVEGDATQFRIILILAVESYASNYGIVYAQVLKRRNSNSLGCS